MSFENILLMRHELLLIAVLLIVLVAEILSDSKNKGWLVDMVLSLFFVQTLVGFLPTGSGSIFGGMYQSFELTILVKNIMNIGVLIILLQSANWLKTKIASEGRVSEFYILLLSTLIGMFYLISSGNFIMFYMGLELATIPMAALIAYELYKKKSSEAGIKFLLSAAMASATYLFGISLIYAATGSLGFEVLSQILHAEPLTVLGLFLIIAGLGFKISLVPFHFWTPDVYEGAPIPITSYLSVLSKSAAIFVLLAILFRVGNALSMYWVQVFYVLIAVTITVGNLFALRQKNMKRFLAYSSIAQAGFILLGILTAVTSGGKFVASGTVYATAVIVFFLLVYVFSNLGAFGVVQAIHDKTGKEEIKDYEGLYRTNPKLSLVMMLSLFSLAGIPPLAGFFGKFFLFTAAAVHGHYILLFVAIINVIVSLYYYLLVIRSMFLRKSDSAIPYFRSNNYMRAGLVMCTIGILVVGVYSPLFDHVIDLAYRYYSLGFFPNAF
jgi:NADH-quinone oxidoreductase subunit N